MKSRTIAINQIPLKVYFWGNERKPALFLLHGWLDTGAGFQFLFEHLRNRFYCIAPDLRGYGKSGHGKNPLGYFFYEYVADLHDLLAKFSPKRPVNLLGHSLGGAIATVYAGTFPERVGRLINVEGFQIPVRKPEIAPLRARRWIEGRGRERFRTFPSLQDFAGRLRLSNPALPPDRALFLAKHLAKKTKRGYTMAADPKHKWVEPYVVSYELYEAFWPRIQSPALLVASEFTDKNRRFSVFDSPDTFRREPTEWPAGTRKVVLPGVGHMVHHERPDLLAEQVLDFFSTDGR